MFTSGKLLFKLLVELFCRRMVELPTKPVVNQETWGQRALNRWTKRLNPGFRRKFRSDFKLLTRKPVQGHSHGEAAAQRAAVDDSITAFITSQGLQPYVVSSSQRSTDLAGCHFHITPRDLQYDEKLDDVTGDHVIHMTDVDYYLDMHSWLAMGRPILAYTWAPVVAGGLVTDASFSISNGLVQYVVRGGARYEHEIWNYDTDMLYVDYACWRIHVGVERIDLGGGRMVVALVPESQTLRVLKLGREIPLERHRFGYKSLSVVRHFDGEKRLVSMAFPGSTQSVTLEERVLSALRIRFENSSKPSITDAETMLRAAGVDNAQLIAPLAYRLLTKGLPALGTPMRVAGSPPVNYQPIMGENTTFEEIKMQGRRVVEPLVDISAEARVPAKTRASEEAGVLGRIVRQSNDVAPTGVYVRWAVEFVKRLVPEAGIGAPLTDAQVLEKQHTPLQRSRMERIWNKIALSDQMKVQAFVKPEAYSAVNDPRIISAVSPKHTLCLSRFTYAFKTLMLATEWYAPGASPTTIAKRLVNVCSKGPVVETDFSRFDGTISAWLRTHVEQAAYLRWVGAEYRPTLAELLKQEIGAKCFTFSGYKFKAGAQRLSGSPLTTDGNTMINAFVTYAAHRKSGLSPADAWDGLGLYAGDDGVSCVGASPIQAVAKELGLKLDCKIVATGTVGFLGRKFRNPFSGDLGSVQDPDRTLRKLHISFSPRTISDSEAARNKALGYLAIDPKAPVVANWCRLVIKELGKGSGITNVGDLPWFATEVMRSGCSTWPQVTTGAVEFTAELLGVGADEVTRWMELIDAAGTTADVAQVVRIPALAAKIPAVEVSDQGQAIVGATNTQPSGSGAQPAGKPVGKRVMKGRPAPGHGKQTVRPDSGLGGERARRPRARARKE